MLNKAFHAPLQKVLSDWVQLNSDNDYFSLLLRGGGGGGGGQLSLKRAIAGRRANAI